MHIFGWRQSPDWMQQSYIFSIFIQIMAKSTFKLKWVGWEIKKTRATLFYETFIRQCFESVLIPYIHIHILFIHIYTTKKYCPFRSFIWLHIDVYSTNIDANAWFTFELISVFQSKCESFRIPHNLRSSFQCMPTHPLRWLEKVLQTIHNGPKWQPI